ncbi:MAG: TIGR00282 family metallophosphoesterase [Acidobacteriota bacterium]
MSEVRILFVGDVIGRPGRRALLHSLLSLIDEHRVDYTIVNVENAAGGFGVNVSVLDELSELPIDCMTTGNHVWDKRDGVALLNETEALLRPANYPEKNPGHGVYVGQTAAGVKIATLNLEGQVFMKALPSPFEAADRLLDELGDDVKIRIVDFHAEATSEKQAMGFYLDGRATAVLGTHTHVPTADARVLPGGTALQTDVGMTGPYESIIGFRADKVLQRFLTQRNAPFEVGKRDVRVAAALIKADPSTGKALSIEGLLVPVSF